MKQQKFKRGNLVFMHNKSCVIKGSYADLFGGDNIDDYSILYLNDGNSRAWCQTDELTLIDIGGEYLIDLCEKIRKKEVEKNTDINYIKENLRELNSDSILYLFELIGFKPSFLKNGEFSLLFHDWDLIRPMFLSVINAKTWSDAKKINDLPFFNRYNFKKAYEKFHPITTETKEDL